MNAFKGGVSRLRPQTMLSGLAVRFSLPERAPAPSLRGALCPLFVRLTGRAAAEAADIAGSGRGLACGCC